MPPPYPLNCWGVDLDPRRCLGLKAALALRAEFTMDSDY